MYTWVLICLIKKKPSNKICFIYDLGQNKKKFKNSYFFLVARPLPPPPSPPLSGWATKKEFFLAASLTFLHIAYLSFLRAKLLYERICPPLTCILFVCQSVSYQICTFLRSYGQHVFVCLTLLYHCTVLSFLFDKMYLVRIFQCNGVWKQLCVCDLICLCF